MALPLGAPVHFGFTDLENRVVSLALDKHYDYAIAARLGLTRREVMFLWQGIKRKVGITSRSLVVDILARMRTLEIEDAKS